MWLQRYLQRHLPFGEIDGAVQETLLAVHRRRHTYDPQYPFRPWLAAMAKHKWVDQLRQIERRQAEELREDIAVADHEAAVTSASVLASLIQELRPAQSQVIALVKLQGYSIAEASRETGQSISAVKVNIHRGLARIARGIDGFASEGFRSGRNVLPGASRIRSAGRPGSGRRLRQGIIKATNRTWEDHWVFAFTVRNGKLTKIREYIDTQTLARASEAA